MAVRLTATATVKGKSMEAEITPEPLEYDSIDAAIEAVSDWARGDFAPSIGRFRKLEITIEAT
jgi:hypothetical protein